jgi:hypothetical protein
VSLTNSTPGGKIKKAKINVLIAVDEQITHTKSGMPMIRFHLSTKHISKKLETMVKQIANPIIDRGSISLKNLWYSTTPRIKAPAPSSVRSE